MLIRGAHRQVTFLKINNNQPPTGLHILFHILKIITSIPNVMIGVTNKDQVRFFRDLGVIRLSQYTHQIGEACLFCPVIQVIHKRLLNINAVHLPIRCHPGKAHREIAGGRTDIGNHSINNNSQ